MNIMTSQVFIPNSWSTGVEPTNTVKRDEDLKEKSEEAVKKAEDSDRLIVRLYESEHCATHAHIRFGFPAIAASEVNLMEKEITPLDLQDSVVQLDFRTFEIKTIAVEV